MADARYATCTNVEVLGPDTRALTFTCEESVGFSGGQYLIVDTGLVTSTTSTTTSAGKAIKRAYSLVSRDHEQHRFVLASKRLPGGPGSGYMHDLKIGDRLKWSGPWGKLTPPPPTTAPTPESPAAIHAVPALPHNQPPASNLPRRTLVLATDTGVTAALGLVSGQRFASLLPHTRFLWLRPDSRDFLPDQWVRARLPVGLALEIAPIPPPSHPERLAHVTTLLADELVPGRLGGAFITGDGAINYALLDRLVTNGLPLTRDNVESFFNYPKKAAAA
jgi:hypothetical protein